MKQWELSKPSFEFKESIDPYGSAWMGHYYFAYDIVKNLRPELVVELGTHYGHSFFSFSQSIKDNNLKTKIFAIDTWKGDAQAGEYAEEVFDKFKSTLESLYFNIGIEYIRSDFDSAVNKFEENSIDILHIDGLHTYDAVKNDFENWLPKVKKNGVILLHDIKVMENDFGVYQLWEELKAKYKTLEFSHSKGLGIVFKCDQTFKLSDLEIDYYQLKSDNDYLVYKNHISDIRYKTLEFEYNRKTEISDQLNEIANAKETLLLSATNKLALREKEILEKEDIINQLSDVLKAKDKQINDRNNELHARLNELQGSIRKLDIANERVRELEQISHQNQSLTNQVKSLEKTYRYIQKNAIDISNEKEYLLGYINNLRSRKTIRVYNTFLKIIGKSTI